MNSKAVTPATPPHTVTRGSQTANTTPQGIVLACGIDTLQVGFSINSYLATPDDFSLLSVAKLKAGAAQFKTKGVGLTWFGWDFSVAAKGTHGYEWVISNDDVSIAIAEKAQGGKVYPEVFVSFRAVYLWGRGYKQAYDEVSSWLRSWAVISCEKVSRCDLSVDVDMPLPIINVTQEFVGRARTKGTHFEYYASGLQSTGYVVGAGDIMARIYDKTAEVKQKQKEWFYTLWESSGWDGESPVTRFEFQLRRDFLKEFSVDGFNDLVERLGDLWRYCSVDWLTVRNPGRDKERSRWRTKDYWIVLQNIVDYFGQQYGVMRYKQRFPKLSHSMDMLKGVMVLVGALSEQIYGSYDGNCDFRSQVFSWFDDMEYRLRVDECKKELAYVG